MSDKFNTNILVAPLDWGLGHSTRCIPIIRHLQLLGCKVILAAEGAQKKLLEKEFPSLQIIELRGYRIAYTTNKRLFAAKILIQLPKVFRAIRYEKRWLTQVMQQYGIGAVISDNRYGLNNYNIPCALITHQLQVKAPFAIGEKILRQVTYYFLKKFTCCWVPDAQGASNLAGLLSHPSVLPLTAITYLGILSRFEPLQKEAYKYKCLVVLSGPEPQRTELENTIVAELKNVEHKLILVRGLPGDVENLAPLKNVDIYNHLSSRELEQAFHDSEYVLSRSGYTTVMDICKLRKKAILVPTPGQTEQEYLAKHLHAQGFCLAAHQDVLNLKKLLQQASTYKFNIPDLPTNGFEKVVEDFVKNTPRYASDFG